MKPYAVTLWVYADSDEEVKQLQDSLDDFTMSRYKQKVYVRASKIHDLIARHGNSPMVNAFIN